MMRRVLGMLMLPLLLACGSDDNDPGDGVDIPSTTGFAFTLTTADGESTPYMGTNATFNYEPVDLDGRSGLRFRLDNLVDFARKSSMTYLPPVDSAMAFVNYAEFIDDFDGPEFYFYTDAGPATPQAVVGSITFTSVASDRIKGTFRATVSFAAFGDVEIRGAFNATFNP